VISRLTRCLAETPKGLLTNFVRAISDWVDKGWYGAAHSPSEPEVGSTKDINRGHRGLHVLPYPPHSSQTPNGMSHTNDQTSNSHAMDRTATTTSDNAPTLNDGGNLEKGFPSVHDQGLLNESSMKEDGILTGPVRSSVLSDLPAGRKSFLLLCFCLSMVSLFARLLWALTDRSYPVCRRCRCLRDLFDGESQLR
jgi:hypothetical protein